MNRQEFEQYIQQGGKLFVVNRASSAHNAYCGYLQKGEIVELKYDDGTSMPAFFYPNKDSSRTRNGADWRYIFLPDLNPLEEPTQNHYDTLHQPIETMQANMTPEAFRGYLRGNIIKYTCRMGRKDGEAELKEAKKILDYAKWLVESLEGKTIDPRKADSLQRRCAEDTKEWRREGNKIILTLVKDGKKVEASASCSPEDTFDYITGTQIALARLAHKCGKPAKVYLPKDTKDFQIEFI